MRDPGYREFLTDLFEAAVDAARPEKLMAAHLPPRPAGRVVVVGAGKASAQMAKGFEEAWEAKHGSPIEGTIVTRYGYGCECRNLEILEAAHPVPDEAGLEASQKLMARVSGLTEDDLVIALVSGGGSALLPAPPDGLSLADEIAVNEALLACGAPISAMNTVRKHVSRIKGGRLAALAHPAKVLSLLISDIPGDHAHLIASGPTVPDAATRVEALEMIRRYDIRLPGRVMQHLRSAASAAPHPEDPVFARAGHHVIASAGISLEAAARKARDAGIEPVILSDSIEGEAREAAKTQAAIARQIAERDQPFAKPVLLLSGGETTVTLKGDGRGGPNTEFMLSLALETDGMAGIFALGADTDGIDGSGDNAGAFVSGDTITQIRKAGIDPFEKLQNNDAWSAFDKTDALFIPGPTGTNINDFRAILITT